MEMADFPDLKALKSGCLHGEYSIASCVLRALIVMGLR